MANTPKKKRTAQPSAAELAARAEAARRARVRTTTLRIAVFCVLVGVVTAIVIVTQGGSDDETAIPATPAAGVDTFDVEPPVHVPGEVDYAQTPPVGGDHNQVWINCGSYDEPLVKEMAVHSMEHGAVWITYAPDLDPDQVSTLRSYAADPYVLVSPWDDSNLPAPVVASAWGARLAVDDASDPGVESFLDTYREASTSPEPGAPCTGGLDG